ncbi:sensor histidine kinase [Bacillus sp. 3255]|uniref:sensor histidine kinase n=1 Tax=Bacillus sp. 3255 TaxID=2817904 RepID=UPI0028673E2A|nr:sensor histidine kinase [Bacillus sp. 3255]MDR6881287.1 two-component system sensor histidine kinase YesM [Bacillus sp. 3255]
MAYLKSSSLKVWHSFANSSMKKKLIIIFVFLITLPLMLTSYISFQYYSKSMQENTQTYVLGTTSELLDKLDDYILDIKRISALPLFMTDMQVKLTQPGQSIDKMRSVEHNVLSINNIKQDTTSVYIIDNYDELYYNLKTDGVRQDIRDKIPYWRQLAKEADGLPVLLSTQEVAYSSGNKDYVFSVVREIRDAASIVPIGMIVFDTSVSVVAKTIQELDSITKGKSMILDQQNHVVYDSDRAFITQSAEGWNFFSKVVGEHGSFAVTMNGIEYICTYTTSSKSDWKMLAFIPVKEVTAKATVTRNVTILVTIGITGFALIVSIVITYFLTNPLSKISRIMKQVQSGNMKVRVHVRYADEVGLLGKHVNQMLERIDELIEEVADGRLRKKEAEMRALQSQINPHFIYNTLETIRMMAELNDDDRVAAMTYNLGQMLRYSLTKGVEVGTVASELEHLEHYLFLQNMRFNDKFTLKLDVPESIKQLPMLKLVLQPVVENAIYHGLEKREGPGEIGISAYHLGEDTYFILSDDGVGMSKETVYKMNDRFDKLTYDKDAKGGIGLQNVNERIKLHYGSDCGLQVESKLGQGTKVMMKIRNDKGSA